MFNYKYNYLFKLKIYLLINLLIISSSVFGFRKKTFFDLLKFSIGSSSTFIKASKYVILLSDNYTTQLLGNKDADKEQSSYIYSILEKKFPKDLESWNNICIKEIDEDIRLNIPYPIVCTDSIIFINPDIYDLINNNERKSSIIEAGDLILSRFTLKTSMALVSIPFLTNLTIKSYLKVLNKLFKKSYFTKANYLIFDSCIFKFIVNEKLTDLYFKHQSKKYSHNNG